MPVPSSLPARASAGWLSRLKYVCIGLAVLSLSVIVAAAPTLAATRHRAKLLKYLRRAPPACPHASVVPTPATVDDADAAILCLVNQQRTSAGLARLSSDGALRSAAVAHAWAMVAEGVFAHFGPGGTSPLQRARSAGYLPCRWSCMVGENIAWGQGASGTPAAIVAAWMNSPDHRANILNPSFRETGVGVAASIPSRHRAGTGGATATQDFATA